MEYLFNAWDRVLQEIGKKNLLIFLDFDGTLAPIVATPDKAVLPKLTRKILKKLSENPNVKLAFISGRRLEDIKNKVGIKNAIYSGNHGLQLEGPKIKFEPMIAPRYRLIIERIKSDLKEKIAHIKGAFVEDKGVILSLHYRLVDKKKIPEVKTIFHEAVILHLVGQKIKIKEGKMVFEVRSPIEWDKGKIVLWLLARRIFASKGAAVIPIYIGDDATDEDAFKVLKNKGVTVFVGSSRRSQAQYFVNNRKEVQIFLERILERYNDRVDEQGTV